MKVVAGVEVDMKNLLEGEGEVVERKSNGEVEEAVGVVSWKHYTAGVDNSNWAACGN